MNERNKELLDKFNKSLKWRYVKYSESIGSGILNKIKRLIFAPDLYIPYLFAKLGIIKMDPLKEIHKFFSNRKTQVSDSPSYFFCKVHNYAELNLTKFFIKNLGSDDIFYDIGANYGFYTYLALEFCKEVHSFEPLDYMIETIRTNTHREIESKKLFLNNVALSNKSGIVDFYFYRNNSDSSSLVIDLNSKDKSVIKVNCITLEEYLTNHNSPTIIKIDVEGAEKMVIEGGLDFFKNNSPIVTIEVWSKSYKGKISMEAVNLLRELGYQSYYIDIEGDIHKIDGDLSQFVEKRNKGLDNFVFKK